MSAAEAERFIGDLKVKPELLDEFQKTASGQGYSGVAEFARQKGYSIDDEDAKSLVSAMINSEMSTEELEKIAGGDFDYSGSDDWGYSSDWSVDSTDPSISNPFNIP
jgi:hypothetical protein